MDQLNIKKLYIDYCLSILENNMNIDFIEHITSKYDSYKHDICCIFIKRCNEYLKISGYQAMITHQAFLFNSRYKLTRANIIRDLSFTSLFNCTNAPLTGT